MKIREKIIASSSRRPLYDIGPTLIWTEVTADLDIFTTAENYTNYLSFEAPFDNPRSPKYLRRILQKMRMKKGTILIKEATPAHVTNIPVHFCAYRIDDQGTMHIFDPSWHRNDPGVYSTSAFYDSLDAFGISYVHTENNHPHYYQSVLPNDVFCQTWSLIWLIDIYDHIGLPLPRTREEAVKHLTNYITGFSQIVLSDIDNYMALFPTYKLEGNVPNNVFQTIIQKVHLILRLM